MDYSTSRRIAFACVGIVAIVAGCKPSEPKPAAPAATPTKPAADPMPAPDDLNLPPEKPADTPANPPAEKAAADSEKGATATPAIESVPIARTSYFRAADGSEKQATIPPVLFTKQQDRLVKVKVGDAFPAMELEQITGGKKALADLLGKTATVVVFWKDDRRMSLTELADLGPDVVDQFGAKGIAVVGVATKMKSDEAKAVLDKTGAKFTNLIDADGNAFAALGSQMLPRTFLLDPQGKVLWFDIEYSHATRRELREALLAVAGKE